MSTLRNIDIYLDKIGQVDLASDLIGGTGSALIIAEANAEDKRVSGWGYALEYDIAISNARKNGMNLDSYLTAQIAVYMKRLNDRKSPLMVWFSSGPGLISKSGLILLYITSRKECRGMPIENAYDNHSLNFLPAGVEPFMYYDDTHIFRTYWRHESIEGKDNLLCDLGQYGPYRIGSADQQRYQEIVKEPLEEGNIDYSPVLMEKEFICQWEGEEVTVERVFCNIKI